MKVSIYLSYLVCCAVAGLCLGTFVATHDITFLFLSIINIVCAWMHIRNYYRIN